MTTRDRSSSSASDHERLDAIRQRAKDGEYYSREHPPTFDADDDMRWLLARLAALEHERDEARVERNSIEAAARYLEREREHAEAALLSLQTAMRGMPDKLNLLADRLRDTRWQPFQTRDEINMGIRRVADAIEAALLPDPVGMIRTKEDDASARVDGDAQASIDRI